MKKLIKLIIYVQIIKRFLLKMSKAGKYIPPQLRKKKRRKCCGGIIVYQDMNFSKKREEEDKFKVLIVHGRASCKWGLPKGGIEKDETNLDCAMREIEEETGLVIKLKKTHKKIRIHSTYYYIINLLSKNYNIEPIDKKEISQIQWIDINKINYTNINRELRDFLLKKDHIINILKSNMELQPITVN